MKINIEFIDMRFDEEHGTIGDLIWKEEYKDGEDTKGFENMSYVYNVLSLNTKYNFDYWTGATGHPLLF